MNLKYLAKLKEKLVAADDFAAVMDYFMTEFGDHKAFLNKGHHVRNQALEAILCEVSKGAFPDAPVVVLAQPRFVEIPAYHFTHGVAFLNGYMSSMFYFSDVQMGMVAIPVSITGLTKFLRFSGKLLSPNLEASDN